MKKDTSMILKNIIDKKAKEFSLEKVKRNNTGSVVSIWREEWHLFSWLVHPLFSILEIQCSIDIDRDFIRAVWFPHPTLITPETKTEFILFSNEANIELHSGGRFWCNEESDFAYEVVMKEKIIEDCTEEAARLLFDIPYLNFKDFHAPLITLAKGVWKSDMAISYIKELRTNGYVYNADYALW